MAWVTHVRSIPVLNFSCALQLMPTLSALCDVDAVNSKENAVELQKKLDIMTANSWIIIGRLI